ncbi:uncharacterized protein BDW47DRAFT_104456 [Aspergillus candidus]|uniref:Uncharacterized protein n=1 Tax=Aspergillus candidus TaxID=41067 RepID=A0A2I2FE11_ASPCN|nr:hypothetical protein BDW47DRAFT_104456 [Aspergillus candidus]PLB38876.1 hypothetical protein BDW47DRAFT_104456 [Aspergillus candidus]
MSRCGSDSQFRATLSFVNNEASPARGGPGLTVYPVLHLYPCTCCAACLPSRFQNDSTLLCGRCAPSPCFPPSAIHWIVHPSNGLLDIHNP